MEWYSSHKIKNKSPEVKPQKYSSATVSWNDKFEYPCGGSLSLTSFDVVLSLLIAVERCLFLDFVLNGAFVKTFVEDDDSGWESLPIEAPDLFVAAVTKQKFLL
jgi:hypothetical protein